ncbi:MAG: hypothetical protein ABJ000_11000 [Saccharospirillum sp.]|uniref:hypothetical protein n=1 Tax=Saccharospirillum sp. TaxID=2033801 RepID=UPI0032986907
MIKLDGKSCGSNGIPQSLIALCLASLSVGAMAEDRNLSIGIGTQLMTLSSEDSGSHQVFVGPRVHLSAAHQYFRIGGTVYQTVNRDNPSMRLDGFALAIHAGVNLDRQGWTGFVGMGQFQETRLRDYQPELEAVAYHASVGGGYHFKRCSLEAEWQWRGNPYGGLDAPAETYMALGLTLSARF